MRTVDFSTSNVPGPPVPLYISGAKIERCFGFGPCGGGALNITCLSYAGELAMAINVDPAAVTAPSLLAECIRHGCDEVLALAPVRAW